MLIPEIKQNPVLLVNYLIKKPEYLMLIDENSLSNTEVLRINIEDKTLNLSNGENISYDKLVLAQGGSPIVPPFEGLGYK